MRSTREIIRQKWELGRSHRAISGSVGVSVGAVSLALSRATAAGLTWASVQALDDAALEALLYPSVLLEAARAEPDRVWIHRERHRVGVTLELLHHEYLERHPGGLRYTAFCDRHRAWAGRRGLVMRQVHVAGDKLFVDYSGKRPCIVDDATGEVVEVELFVAALGASNLTYAEATRTQRGPDWIASHVRTLEYLGGVPAALVPDQLKSGVTRSCAYEPEVQRTYDELGQHYGTTVMPARPLHPRDKAKVEVAVQIAQRWLLARIRNEVFHSLGALNARLRELLVDLNGRVMRRYGKSRREMFEAIERAALRPLPATRFEYAEWQRARVNIDYHLQVEGHLYSVPYRLVHEEVEARTSGDVVEILHGRTRVASHRRSPVRGGFTTQTEHMPSAHRAHRFRGRYNDVPPHEALGGKTPASHYAPSHCPMPDCLRSPEYPDAMKTRRLDSDGRLCVGAKPFLFCRALASEPVGLELVEEDTWEVFYGSILLAEVRVRGRGDVLVRCVV